MPTLVVSFLLCAAAQPTPGPDLLTAVERVLEGTRPERAGRLLRELLARDDGEPPPERARLEELVVRCAFAETYREPELVALLGGDRCRWRARSGRLEARYPRDGPRAATADDAVGTAPDPFTFHPLGFSEVDGALLSDVSFSGTCRITVEGVLPPGGRLRDHPPRLLLAVDDDLVYTVDFTWPTRYRRSVGDWTQGRADRWLRGDAVQLAEDRTPGGKYDMMWGERYRLKLVVKRDVLAATLNGFDMLVADKDDARSGRLGFRWCPGVTEVRLDGVVDDAEIDGLRAAHREEALATFREAADVETLLADFGALRTSPSSTGPDRRRRTRRGRGPPADRRAGPGGAARRASGSR